MPLASQLSSENPLHFRECFDISVPLASAPAWPGDRQFSLEWISGLQPEMQPGPGNGAESDQKGRYGQQGRLKDEAGGGSGCLLSAVSLSSHAATHLDFPGHVLPGGRRLDGYSLQHFILPAWVVHAAGPKRAVPACTLREGLPDGVIPPGEAILFKTSNSERRLLSRPAFSQDFVSLSVEAAHLCADGQAALVGIDYLSVDEYEGESLPVHRILLESNILILEGIDLSAVPAGRYTLICLPLSLGEAEASPVRAVLVR